MTILLKLLNTAAGLAFAPLLIGVINRTKAWCAGRTGPPLSLLHAKEDNCS